MGKTKKEKKPFKMPHSMVIMVIIIFAATVLTWLVPAGEFNRIENAQGVSVVDPNSFHWLERSSVNFLLIPYSFGLPWSPNFPKRLPPVA